MRKISSHRQGHNKVIWVMFRIEYGRFRDGYHKATKNVELLNVELNFQPVTII